MSIFIDGFLGSRLYAISPAIRLDAKLSIERCLVCMLYVVDVLELVVDGFHKCSFPEQNLVVQVHKRILHVLLDFRDKVYVIDKKILKQFLAYVSPVGEYLSEQSLSEVLVFQWFTVVRVSQRKGPLYYLVTFVDYDVQLESVEPAHRTLAIGRPSPHRPMAVCPLYLCGMTQAVWNR